MKNEWHEYYKGQDVYFAEGTLEFHKGDVPLIVLDFDGTLHSHYEALLNHPTAPDIEFDSLEHYYHLRDIVGEEWMESIEKEESMLDLMLDVGVYPNVKESLERLSKIANVVIMTHRKSYKGPLVQEFLQKVDLPYMYLICGAVDKIEFCKDHNVSILVDDKPSTLQKAKEHNQKTASLIHSYNHQDLVELEVPSAKEWKDLLEKILDVVSG